MNLEYEIIFIKEQYHEMKGLYDGLKHENDKIKKQVKELQTEIKKLKNVHKKSEKYYQRFLEVKYNAFHKVNKFGVTDLETDTEIMEIKNWNNYKSALGQLQFYNHGSEKQLTVFFFGERLSEEITTEIIQVYSKKKINVKELIENEDNTIKINNLYITSESDETKELKKYLKETYERKDGDENRVTCKEVWNSYKAWLALSKKRMLKDELNDLFEEVFELEPGIFVKNVKLWKNMIIKK